MFSKLFSYLYHDNVVVCRRAPRKDFLNQTAENALSQYRRDRIGNELEGKELGMKGTPAPQYKRRCLYNVVKQSLSAGKVN